MGLQSPPQLGQLRASDILCWTGILLHRNPHSLPPITNMLFPSYQILLKQEKPRKASLWEDFKVDEARWFQRLLLQNHFFVRKKEGKKKNPTLILQSY